MIEKYRSKSKIANLILVRMPLAVCDLQTWKPLSHTYAYDHTFWLSVLEMKLFFGTEIVYFSIL